MLRELAVSELRYRAVLEVLDGATVTGVARRFGVARQTVHVWLRRSAAEGAVLNLEDRSSRPHSCPHQMLPGGRGSGAGDPRCEPAVGSGPDPVPAAA